MPNHPNRKRVTKKKPTITSSAAPVHNHDLDYAALLQSIREAFRVDKGPLFQTDARDLYERYLDGLPSERQVHDCHACRRFIQHFGGIVTIDQFGGQHPVMWNTERVPEFYLRSVGTMANAVVNAHVLSPFLLSAPILGIPQTGDWTHMAVTQAKPYAHPLLTAHQAMAAKRENFGDVARVLSEFSAPMLATALRALDSSWLASEQKFIAPLKWLADLHAKRTAAKNSRVRDNLLWLAVATAPEGYCHPRASMIGTLLEDIAAGLPFESVRTRFNAKVHPLQYQRPQAAPSAGNIAEGEKIIAKLGLDRSLVRRFARLDECVTIWKPQAPAAPSSPVGGVFAHLTPKDHPASIPPLTIPPQTMTWEKFARVVLPTAEKIEVKIVGGPRNFVAYVTAEHADAPPIMKWDHPVSWYTYHNGSHPEQWRMTPGWAKVTGISPAPPLWGDDPKPHLGSGMLLILEGCADTQTGPGNALFPECLRAELYGIRATIEAYSRSAELLGREQASACGLYIGAKGAIGYDFRVTAGGVQTLYRADRWD